MRCNKLLPITVILEVTERKQVTDPETGETKSVPDPVETGAILIENKTGKIISFVGGRDYKREQLNHATDAYRSNGSTMKPLLALRSSY